MFFVFYILILIINCVSYSNNFVLKALNQPLHDDIKQNDMQNILQDVFYNSLHITTAGRSKFKTEKSLTNKKHPNLKVNNSDKNLSEEMLSIKQNMKKIEQKGLSGLKNTQHKSQIAIPKLNFKQEWPPANYFSKPDELEKLPKNNDNLLLKYLIADEMENDSSINGKQLIPDSRDDKTVKRNQSHGLARHVLNYGGMTTSNHTCSRTPICSPGDSTHQCLGSTKTVLTYTLMPFYLPYEPYFHQQPIFYTQPTSASSFPPFEYIYDDDEKEKVRNVEEYNDDDYYENFNHITTRKIKKKKHKKVDYDADSNFINVDYSAKPRKPKLEWNVTFLENHPNKLIQDLIDDLAELYPESTIRKCYCSATGCNCPIVYMIFLFFSLCLFWNI